MVPELVVVLAVDKGAIGGGGGSGGRGGGDRGWGSSRGSSGGGGTSSSATGHGSAGLGAGAASGGTRLGVGANGLQLGLLVHHLLEVNITALGVLVTVLSGVDTRGIGGVSFEGLEGVEVVGRARGVGVPGGVDILLGGVVPELVVVLAVLEVEVGGETSAVKGGGEGRGASGQGKDDSRVLELQGNRGTKRLEG